MFGFRNTTKYAFLTRVTTVSIEFGIGVVEEVVSFNFSGVGAANAAEIPENFNLNSLPKDQIITTTSS